ncbi:MAG: DUF294 nucleotidyltransferase-like domain-containing protein [Deferrisomatales bacterium]
MSGELDTLLGAIPALRSVPPGSLDELEEALVRSRVAEGEYLFRWGEDRPGAKVVYLVSASAELLLGPPGEEVPVGRCGPGQFVGWVAAFTRDLFPVSARVVGAGEVLWIPSEPLRALVAKHASLGPVVAAETARHLDDLLRGLGETGAPREGPGRGLLPWRVRVRDVMAGPAVTLPPEATARRAAEAMAAAEVGSVVVVEGETPRGLVSEQDLVRRVLAGGRDPDRTVLAEICSGPLETVSADDLLYKALGIMRRRGIAHLGVCDAGRLCGAVSLRTVLAAAGGEAIELDGEIEEAPGLDDLARVSRRGRQVCARLVEEGEAAHEVSRLLARLNRDVHRRVLELARDELRGEGWGEPPVPFCFILMGSHGRGENHFHTDQDHGMILADYPPGDWHRVEPYFMELGERVSRGLERVGFPLCRGNVMSSNPVWRKTAGQWKEQIRGWYADPSSKAVRYSTLFYDFQPAWGEAALAEDLRRFVTEGIRRNHQLLRSLYEEASGHRARLTVFRNFVVERSGPHKGELDLKRSGLLFLTECARILALRHGIAATGTAERLEALARAGAVAPEEAEFARTAHRTLLHLLLHAQVRKLRAGAPLDNYVAPRALPIQERYLLRHALEATGRLQAVVHAAFGDVLF